MEYDEDGRPIFGPVVNFTDEDVRLGVEAAREADPSSRACAWHYSPSPAIDSTWEPEIPHNYVTGIGDCFDWLDHDTRMMVREAIELAEVV
jgi:hypothetical protein